ncbi:hypothetical protein ASZ90_009528 [hydrocarbon metagenome]|uniref:Uncharacterized protein n=1 Tax=hydrocarbon metagenome TaxID=938273 RepID=A0A0W8FIM2_9ZZZZ
MPEGIRVPDRADVNPRCDLCPGGGGSTGENAAISSNTPV